MRIYDEKVKDWTVETEDIFINSEYGKVYVLTCGSVTNPPLVMIHAASMGAHSWVENLEPLLDHYRIYSIDNIGEGNKSELAKLAAEEFPDIRIEVLESGHLVSVEHADYVNKIVSDFLMH